MAYDKRKCATNASKLQKLLKPHKRLRFKDVFADINEVKAAEKGMKAEELKTMLDVPFADLGWTKKFIKYLENVEKYCAR
jgi:hypothetical protein